MFSTLLYAFAHPANLCPGGKVSEDQKEIRELLSLRLTWALPVSYCPDPAAFSSHSEKENMIFLSDSPELLKTAAGQGMACIGFEAKGFSYWGIPYLAGSIEAISLSWLDEIWHRHHRLPLTIASSHRLLLRETTMEDLPFLEELYQDPRVIRYTPSFFPDSDHRGFLDAYIKNMYPLRGFGMWSLTERNTGEFLGHFGFDLDQRPQKDPSSLPLLAGYALLPGAWGHGYGAEGLALCLSRAKAYISEGAISHVIFRIHPDNQASLRMYLALRQQFPFIRLEYALN